MKFDEILQRYEDSLMAYNRAAGLMDKGRLDEAEELLKAALSRYPREVFMDDDQELDASMLDSIDTLFTNISDRLELVRSIKSGPKLGAAGILTLRDLVERNALKRKSDPERPSGSQNDFSTDASVDLDYTASKLDEEEFERVWDDDSKSGAQDAVGTDVLDAPATDDLGAAAELSAEDIILSGLTDVRAEEVEAASEANAPEPQEKNPPEIDEALAAIEAFEEMDAGSGGQTEKGEFDSIEMDIETEHEAPAAAEETAESDAAPISAEEEKSLEDILAGTLTDAPPPEDIELVDEELHSARIPETAPAAETEPAPAPDEEKVKKALEAVAAAADHTEETTKESTPEAAEEDADETAADGEPATVKKKAGFFSKLTILKKPKKIKKSEPQEAELLEMSDEGPANATEEPPEKTDEEAGDPKKMKKLKLFSIGKKKKSSGEELKDVEEQTEEIETEEPAAEAKSVAEAAQEEPAAEVSAAFSTPPAPVIANTDEKDEEDEALLSKDEIKKQYGPAHKHTIIERTTVNVSGIFSSIFVVLMLLAGFADLGYRIYTDVYLGGLDSLYKSGEKAAMSEPLKMDDALASFLQYRSALPDTGSDKNKISAYLPVAWSFKLRNEKNRPDDALMMIRIIRREDIKTSALDEEFVSALIMKAEQSASGGGEEFEEMTSRARQILSEGRVAEPRALSMLDRLDALEAGAAAVKTSSK